MKKITMPVFIGIVVAFVIVLAAVAITGTMLYDQYNYNNLISSFHHPITTSGIDKFGIKEIYPTRIVDEE